MNARYENKHDLRAEPAVDLLARLAHTERQRGEWPHQQPAPKGRPWTLIAIAIVASAAVSSLATVGMLERDKPSSAAADAVRVNPAPAVAAPSSGPAASLEAAGYVVARNKSSVSSDITGRVKSINVVVGQTVNKGDIIAHLDDREALLRLSAAEINVTQSRLAAENTRVLLKNESEKMAQLQSLVGQKFVSDAAFRQTVTAHDSAAIAVRTADANRADAENSLQAARIFVERHVIRAPFTGVVSVVTAGPGETVSPTSGGGNSFIRSGIVQLVDPVSLYVVAEVPERQIGPIHVGQQVEVVGKAAGGGAFASQVTWVAPVSNRQRGVVEVGIDLTDPSRRFIDGMEVNVRFMGGKAGSQKSNQE